MNTIKKHLISVKSIRNYQTLHYFTLTKIINRLLSQIEYRQKKIKLKSLPYLYYIDVGNFCNLKCPLCPTGNSSDKRKRQFMNFETYKKIFDKIKKHSLYVNLYNWGEPFLNKDILKIIEYTKKNKVGVILSTNFNNVNDDTIKSIVKLQVDKIIISIDGSDQHSYTTYRRNGDFNKVLLNLKKLLSIKMVLKSRYPLIVWQYLVSKKNEKFTNEASKLAKELGIKIVFPKFQISQEIVLKKQIIDKKLVDEWITDENKKHEKDYTFRIKSPCEYLYYYMIINPEGTTSPCCAIYDSKTDFGDLLNNDLKTVWNNTNYLSARSLFSSKKILNKNKTICEDCATVFVS